MAKLLSTIALIFAIVLFPPSVLALVSNNAVPGDATYPIKRSLEDGILVLVSISPATKAWFTVSRTDRRFKEAKVLIAQGKSSAGDSLQELVEQTTIAVNEINQVTDSVKKEQLKQELSLSIQKYNQELDQIKQRAQSQIPASTPIPSPVLVVSATPSITVQPSLAPSEQPKMSVIPSVNTNIASTPSINLPVTDTQISSVQQQLQRIQENLKHSDRQRREDRKDQNESDKNKNNGSPGRSDERKGVGNNRQEGKEADKKND